MGYAGRRPKNLTIRVTISKQTFWNMVLSAQKLENSLSIKKSQCMVPCPLATPF